MSSLNSFYGGSTSLLLVLLSLSCVSMQSDTYTFEYEYSSTEPIEQLYLFKKYNAEEAPKLLDSMDVFPVDHNIVFRRDHNTAFAIRETSLLQTFTYANVRTRRRSVMLGVFRIEGDSLTIPGEWEILGRVDKSVDSLSFNDHTLTAHSRGEEVYFDISAYLERD